MLLRPILSRVCKYQRLANFCSIGNVQTSIANSETAISLSEVSSKENSVEKSDVVSYLINSCGIAPEKAISASAKVRFDNPDKPNAVLSFLKSYGFSKTQIAELVSRQPLILLSNPEKSFLPKIEFFLHSTGICKTDVVNTIARHPAYLTRSLEKQLLPVYGYLKEIIGSEKVATLLRRGSWVFGRCPNEKLIKNVDFLREIGVPPACIELAVFNYPDAISQKHDPFKEIVAEVTSMGFDRLKSTFVVAIHARSGKRNKALWAQCYETYSKWGWSEDDIYMAFGKHPNCMLLSEKKISGFLDFVVNKMGRESRMVARVPSIIFYSLEKRIIPRCSVLDLLVSNGLIKEDWCLTTILGPPENNFLNKYVAKYEKILPQLYDVYQGKRRDVESLI